MRGRRRDFFRHFFAPEEKKTRNKKKLKTFFLSTKNLPLKTNIIKVYRFYMRCSACSAEMTFKTDPANTGYAVEAGATRNYEPWRDKKDGGDGDDGGGGGGGGAAACCCRESLL